MVGGCEKADPKVDFPLNLAKSKWQCGLAISTLITSKQFSTVNLDNKRINSASATRPNQLLLAVRSHHQPHTLVRRLLSRNE